MLVSWNWLKEYVDLPMASDELENRLAMSGLNHEGTETLADDLVIDLEVTSNRPDCLGHVGVAREISVLWKQPLRIPDPQPQAAKTPVAEAASLNVECPELCPRYTARVIRGVRVGPSPDWLAERLTAIGIGVVNNIVDVTNYVLMESGQPLHAFDLARIQGRKIIVREARAGEKFQAIDHRTYDLVPGMCVIADASRPIALGGVMGGVDSEVGESTVDVLVEAAQFAPLSIRNTARRLNLHSPSSYRFERGLDPAGVDWASRRCCELILELAGGQLLDGVLDVNASTVEPARVTLRLSQLKRVLGIEVPPAEVERILSELGGQIVNASNASVEIDAPSWRRDLTREIDLIEEVARIHGYDQIPEDVAVPMAPSHRSDDDRVLSGVRQVMTAAGFDEAMTISMVSESLSEAFSPWSDREPLRCSAAMLKGADLLRRSLVPSLLESRRTNESLANVDVELFETAHVYLPNEQGLPTERSMLALTSGRGFLFVKGVLETMVARITKVGQLEAKPHVEPLLDQERSCELVLKDRRLGFLGEIRRDKLRDLGLRQPAAVAEIDLNSLAEFALLVPQHAEQSPYPAMDRDLNLIVSEDLLWDDLAKTIRSSAGDFLETLSYRETYRDAQRDGTGKKRLLFSITLRSGERTLTGEEADEIRTRVESACENQHGAVLVR